MTHPAFEKEFFSLAKWMLGCRLRCMGGDVECDIPHGDLAFSLLGYVDHADEMGLLCAEVLEK